MTTTAICEELISYNIVGDPLQNYGYSSAHLTGSLVPQTPVYVPYNSPTCCTTNHGWHKICRYNLKLLILLYAIIQIISWYYILIYAIGIKIIMIQNDILKPYYDL